MSGTTGYLVSYEVSDDKRRRKVEKIISERGVRIQYSCFYCPVDRKAILSLLIRLMKIIDKTKDSVIAVSLSKDWEKLTIGTLRNPVVSPRNERRVI